MTSYTSATVALYDVISDSEAWSHPLALENQPFTPADDEPWARFSIRHLSSSQDTLGKEGSRDFLRRGLIVVQVFVPSDTGVHTATELCQQVRDLYEGRKIGGVNVYAGSTIELGLDGKFYQVNVEFPFDYVETK